MTHTPNRQSTNTQTISVAQRIARGFFKTDVDEVSLRGAVRRWLLAIPAVVILVPMVFWLRFGEVGPMGLGLTIFFVVYCLLSAIGLHFLVRPEYHTPVEFRNDWIDRVGGFWLVACAFGPLFGWLLTSGAWVTFESWRWFYTARVVLAIGLPVLTACALLRYVRGKGAPLMLALLLGVTALPVWSSWATLKDLRRGVIGRDVDQMWLPFTNRVLD